MWEMRQQIPKETNVPFTPPATHSHEAFFLIGMAFANIFFNRETNCSQLEASIQQCISNKPPKFHNPQIPTFHLLSFFLYLYPTFCSQYPQLLPGKLFNVRTVSPEQHHATEQVKIRPKDRAAQNTPSLPLFLLWSWTRASKGSSLLVLAWAVTRLRVISSSCDNLVWALCSPSGRWGFLNLGAKKLMSATSQGTPKAESYFLHVNQDFAVLICLPYLNSCNTGAACSLAMAC